MTQLIEWWAPAAGVAAVLVAAMLALHHRYRRKQFASRLDYATKCKRRRADGSTPCLCCPGECVG